MKMWEVVAQIEKNGLGYGIQGEITRDRLALIRCPGMYGHKGLTDYSDSKYTNCQDFSHDYHYTPCYACWDREFESNNESSKVGE